MGFEPTRAEHNGLAVHRLNHSATSSTHNGNKISTIITLARYIDYTVIVLLAW